MQKSITDKTITGLNWNFINIYSNSLLTTIIGIVLARILTPKEFGLIGMVLIFTGLADLFATLGLGKSIIKLKNLNNNHIGIATFFTISSSIIIFIIFYFLAPLISAYYNEPQLINILRYLSIIFILKGLSTVSYSQIIKKLEFGTITKISIVSSFFYGLVSIILAYFNFGVWSLVWGKISSQLIATILSIIKFPIKISFKYNSNETKELVSFGGGVSLSNILFYGTSNIDYFIIGKVLNSELLGLYTRAFNFVTQTMGQITSGTMNVLFPAFSALQNDKEKLRNAYFRTVKTVSFLLMPIMLSMVVLSKEIILGLYGPKWSGATTSLQILLVAGVFRITLQYSGAIAHATGKVYSEVQRQFFYFLIVAVGAYFLVDFGIEGVAVAVLISRIYMFIALSSLALKILNTKWIDYLLLYIPAIINSTIMVISNFILVLFFNNYFENLNNEFKIVILIFINVLLILSTFIINIKFTKDDTIDWLFEKYSKFLPNIALRIFKSLRRHKKKG